jgi:hypothetical protein
MISNQVSKISSFSSPDGISPPSPHAKIEKD